MSAWDPARTFLSCGMRPAARMLLILMCRLSFTKMLSHTSLARLQQFGAGPQVAEGQIHGQLGSVLLASEPRV